VTVDDDEIDAVVGSGSGAATAPRRRRRSVGRTAR